MLTKFCFNYMKHKENNFKKNIWHNSAVYYYTPKEQNYTKTKCFLEIPSDPKHFVTGSQLQKQNLSLNVICKHIVCQF